MRFINNLRCAKNNKELVLSKYITLAEFNEAKRIWLEANQRMLRRSSNFANLWNQLNLFEDEHGIIRSKGRINNAKLPYKTKFPIILDRKHKLTKLICMDCHGRAMHRGEKQTLTELRSEYWIARGKSFVKGVIHRCSVCKRIHGRPYTYPAVPDLPIERLYEGRPFLAIGVDHCGPIYIKDVYGSENDEEDKLNKGYIVLYTCASTRGVVLEGVRDASSTAFLESIRRFIARRGCPQVVVSDNGSAYTASETQQFVTERNIDWRFNVPAAPWMGGFFERLVACVKNCLKKQSVALHYVMMSF